MEHRWGRRVKVDFPVRVTALRFSVRDGKLTDLSVSGASIIAALEARVLSRVQITIVSPLWAKHESAVVEAYVTRRYKDGFGVEWCEFSPPAVSKLLRCLIARPHARSHRPVTPVTSLTVSRLSPPLLKHGA
jgi:hypothetical protein